MRVLLRGLLTALALVVTTLGAWQSFWPRGFYDNFPTVSLLPPFNEHMMRDFGFTSLGLAVVIGAAAFVLEFRLVVLALVAYLIFAVPHLVFHMTHVAGASPADVVFLVVSLGASVALPVVTLGVAGRVRASALAADPPE
jgi:hypothetical protein